MWGSDLKTEKPCCGRIMSLMLARTDDVWKYSELVKDFHQEQGIIVNRGLGENILSN